MSTSVSVSSSSSPLQRWKDERLVNQRALLPLLLSSLPEPDCSEIGLPAPRAHLHFTARAGHRANRQLEPQRLGPALPVGSWRTRCRRRPGRRWQVEAPSDGESRVPVLPKRAGWNGGLPHSVQAGKQSGLHVHPLCPQCQVRITHGLNRTLINEY